MDYFKHRNTQIRVSYESYNVFKMRNSATWSYSGPIGIYRNTSEENPEMCHFIPLIGSI